MYYFAYGSNMSERVFTDRVAGQSAGRAALHGWRLAFSLPSKRWGGRAADIVPTRGAVVWGRLWRIEGDTLDALDLWERNYRRIDVEVSRAVDPEHATVTAATYAVRDERRAPTEDSPTQGYLEAMLAGAAEARLPGSYTQLLVDHASRLRGA